MTKGMLQILENSGNEDDLVAFMQDKNLPVDDIEARKIAREFSKTVRSKGILQSPTRFSGDSSIAESLNRREQYKVSSRFASKDDEKKGEKDLGVRGFSNTRQSSC